MEQFEEEQRVKRMFLSYSGFDDSIIEQLMERIYVKILTQENSGFLKI